jgi:hypothetical protein
MDFYGPEKSSEGLNPPIWVSNRGIYELNMGII